MFVYVYYLSESQQPRHNEQVYSFTQRWRHCRSLFIYAEMAPLYKFTHLYRDGAPVQVYSFTQRWRRCTSLLISQRWRFCTSLLIYTERTPLYKFSHLHRDGATVQAQPLIKQADSKRASSNVKYHGVKNVASATRWTVYERFNPCEVRLNQTSENSKFQFSRFL